MARIAGVDLPSQERIGFSLTHLYGVGPSLAQEVLKEAGIPPARRTGELSEEEIARLGKIVETHKVEGDLRREVLQNIQRLRDLASYRGTRHAKNLPVRGQRTRTNARTKRGKRKTVGAFKKEVLAKQTTQQERRKAESGG